MNIIRSQFLFPGIALLVLLILLIGIFTFLERQDKALPVKEAAKQEEVQGQRQPATVATENLPERAVLPQSNFVAQSFNNCGPASLSMVMSMFGVHVSQEELADQMRPFHNPQGGVDDKSIFAPEFVTYAREYGFASLHRPNGSIELLKKFVANDIPVVVRTWLHPGEDIGHFRIVRGYDEEKKVVIQDDSYQGPNLEYSYDEFLSMWQPFNYGYILVYPKDKQAVVDAILGEEKDEQVAWQHALARAEEEVAQNSSDAYAKFNEATAYYYLGKYDQTISFYEQAQSGLPPRMLWYQLEPIEAYLKTKQYDKVFGLTDQILDNGNKAYSELYLMRGKAYKEQGKVDLARAEFEKAVYYNTNSKEAQDALASL